MSDLISRQKAINTAENMYGVCDTGYMTDYKDLVIEALEELPSAERKGKWIEDKYGNILCSECNWSAPKVMVGLADRHLDYEKSDYCWHCGARMVSEDDT